MEITTTAPDTTSPLITLKQFSPTAQLYLILVMLVLAVLAVGLGIYSASENTSPIDSTTPPVLIHTTPVTNAPVYRA